MFNCHENHLLYSVKYINEAKHITKRKSNDADNKIERDQEEE